LFRLRRWPRPIRQKGPTCVPTAGRDLGRSICLRVSPGSPNLW
jgi:hypothetical protein